jgi:hypothetical protein
MKLATSLTPNLDKPLTITILAKKAGRAVAISNRVGNNARPQPTSVRAFNSLKYPQLVRLRLPNPS